MATGGSCRLNAGGIRAGSPCPPTWVLADVDARARENPETFRVPPDKIRQNLRRGHFVKLIFELAEAVPGVDLGEAVPPLRDERMWVQVTELHGKGRYAGTLDSQATFLPVRAGDRVEFEAKHIAAVESPS